MELGRPINGLKIIFKFTGASLLSKLFRNTKYSILYIVDVLQINMKLRKLTHAVSLVSSAERNPPKQNICIHPACLRTERSAEADQPFLFKSDR